jgi:hypothetical protein
MEKWLKGARVPQMRGASKRRRGRITLSNLLFARVVTRAIVR